MMLGVGHLHLHVYYTKSSLLSKGNAQKSISARSRELSLNSNKVCSNLDEILLT